MELKEIFDTIECDQDMDKELQKDILEKIESIARADSLVDGLEEKIEQNKDELTDKELKYIINKCIAYKSVFYRFRNGGIIDYDQLNEITNRIFELEESIRKNDFHVWRDELRAYKGSKQDKEEDKMIKNMLAVVPEETNVVEKITRMFRRAMWKMQQKSKGVQTEEVIELPQTNMDIDIEVSDSYYDNNPPKTLEEQILEENEKDKIDEDLEEELEDKFGGEFIEEEEQEETEKQENKEGKKE